MPERFLQDRRGFWSIVLQILVYTFIWFLFTLVIFVWSRIYFSALYSILGFELVIRYEEQFYKEVFEVAATAVVPTLLFANLERQNKKDALRAYLIDTFD